MSSVQRSARRAVRGGGRGLGRGACGTAEGGSWCEGTTRGTATRTTQRRPSLARVHPSWGAATSGSPPGAPVCTLRGATAHACGQGGASPPPSGTWRERGTGWDRAVTHDPCWAGCSHATSSGSVLHQGPAAPRAGPPPRPPHPHRPTARPRFPSLSFFPGLSTTIVFPRKTSQSQGHKETCPFWCRLWPPEPVS